MVRIRLQRRGYKKHPFYAVVAAEIHMPRDGRFLEKIGTYDPHQKEDKNKFKVKSDRMAHWLSKGAQPSDTVARLIKNMESAT